MDAKVRDVMTPGPIGVDYHQSIGEAARTMRDWGVGARPRGQRPVAVRRGHRPRSGGEGGRRGAGADEPVGPLSSADVIGVDADADVHEAMRLMREHAVRRLPVLEDGQVAGIVSLGDLALPDEPAFAFARLSPVTAAV